MDNLIKFGALLFALISSYSLIMNKAVEAYLAVIVSVLMIILLELRKGKND